MTDKSETGIRQVRTTPHHRRPWAVILAGGDGVRLRPLSRLISGDDRPKQFCPLFGDRSLLGHTRRRVAGLASEDQTLFVVTRPHERFYSGELADITPRQVIVQPSNRGTGTAIACAVLRIMERDPDAVVAFFPSDHYYADENLFQSAVEAAAATAGEHPESVVLLGAEATHPETGYGWIEPGPAPVWNTNGRLHCVNRFWEKPSLDRAQILQSQGCLWNTFVMVGRASAFFSMLESAVPGLLQGVYHVKENGWPDNVPSVDFSQHVLSLSVTQLFVVRLAAKVGWNDLGEPQRVLATLAQVGIEPSQEPLQAWLRSGNPERATRTGSMAAVA